MQWHLIYPKLDKAMWRHVKLSETDKATIISRFKGGAKRKELAAHFKVSYHSIYLLTCNPKTKRVYTQRLKVASRLQWQKILANPVLHEKRIEQMRDTRSYRKKMNSAYRKL